ncbi:hypothetical protein [Aquimarina sp. 2201CG5-10]|uniref:hypothetical protein n=1 Tax=Aquimarina callyspongiae TaxID=3098150 RepID=UPI002AB5A6F9|nr:hypothetical protein [Aquimarina sp. 2201CG5-10]MDY8134679.1 hypothetical protein [Aquimarina sp. 2201CG5-10]
MNLIKKTSRNQTRVIIIALMVLIQGCSVRLISDYDNITDKTVTELQEKVSNYFVRLERTINNNDEVKYENFIKQFDAIKVDLNNIEVRAAALEKNRIIQEKVKELKNAIENLESSHKEGFSHYDQIKPLKRSFNVIFTAMVKFQLALKRGEKLKKIK